MPRVILPSATQQKDTVFLVSWLEERIRLRDEEEDDRAAIHLPMHKFVPKLRTSDLRNPQLSSRVLRNPSHFVKIVKFHRVDRYRVFATVRDNAHMILS